MLSLFKHAAIFFVSLLVISCAFSPPERMAYGGADSVSTISPDMLVGNWNIRILNPIEGEDTIKNIRADYRPNGTVVMKTLTQTTTGPMGTVALEMTGSWTIEGDYVRQQLNDIKETSGNSVANFLIGMMGSAKERFSGTANVYEASVQRVVLVSDNGQAQELTRLP